VVGRLERDGYAVENVIFESQLQFYVTGNLYIPKEGERPAPAMLHACGHTANGKAGDEYQRLCIFLAKRGFVVFSFDPIGQGERGPYGEAGSGNEHDVVGRQCFLTGSHLANLMMWDAVRAIDYLVSREEVDADRIGITGCSGGGTLVTHILAVEPRISAAEPVCFVTTLRGIIEELNGPADQTGDPEQVPLGMLSYGIEHADLLLAFAPRPLQIGAAKQDYFDIVGTRRTFRELKRLYGILGAGENVNLTESFTKHGYPQAIRESMVGWMGRWLGLPDAGGPEPEITVEPERNLLCTDTGLVATSLGGHSASSLNKQVGLGVIPAREPLTGVAAFPAYRERILDTMQRLHGYEAVPCDLQPQVFEARDGEGYRVEKLVYTSEPGITVPGLLFRPAGDVDGGAGKPLPAILHLHEAGKSAVIDDAQDLARDGNLVLCIDPRGIGETAVEDAQLWSEHVSLMDTWHYYALMLNRTVFGMQLLDVIRALDYLQSRPEVDVGCIRCIGYGMGGLLAMHAAAMDERVAGVVVRAGLGTYRSLILDPMVAYGGETIVPNVLAHYDLPDIAACIAPRPISLVGPLDQHKRPLSADALETDYAWTAGMFRLLGASEALFLYPASPRSRRNRGQVEFAQ
jgi:cephalosporin-C deacetylase-like acetyl esterase